MRRGKEREGKEGRWEGGGGGGKERKGDEWKRGEQRPGRERKEEEKRIGEGGEGRRQRERGLRMSQWCKPCQMKSYLHPST